MAQVLAIPGDVRHGFNYKGQFNHEFGRITGIAATTKANILVCDYDNTNLMLFAPTGTHFRTLNLDSEPFDLAITSQNIGYVTQPNTRTVLQIDPDRMVILNKVTSNDLFTTVVCASAVPNSGRDIPNKFPCYLGVRVNGSLFICPVNGYDIILTDLPAIKQSGGILADPRVVKFHAANTGGIYSCIGGQSYISIKKPGYPYSYANITIKTMDTPTDICSDNNGHVYVSGQCSNNIHRLTQDGKVLDIPLDSQHGIIQPVALCFNKNCTKLYIAINWGKFVLVFDVI